MTTIHFKSIPPNYAKEKDGRKPNTIRNLPSDEPRAVALEKGEPTHIVIENTVTGEAFMRQITDISYWDGRFIISWKHDEKGGIL